jgi:hypothetical protein
MKFLDLYLFYPLYLGIFFKFNLDNKEYEFISYLIMCLYAITTYFYIYFPIFMLVVVLFFFNFKDEFIRNMLFIVFFSYFVNLSKLMRTHINLNWLPPICCFLIGFCISHFTVCSWFNQNYLLLDNEIDKIKQSFK